MSLDTSLPFSGSWVLAPDKTCCAHRTDARIPSSAVPARAPSWPAQPGKNAVPPSTAGSGPQGPGGHLGILGREGQIVLWLWLASRNSRKQMPTQWNPEGEGGFSPPTSGNPPLPAMDRNGNQTWNGQRARKGNSSRTGLGCAWQDLSVSGRQGGGSSWTERPSLQRGGSSRLGRPAPAPVLTPLGLCYFLPPAVCFGSLPGHRTLRLLPSPAL